jgi:hypothetical protein
MKFRILVPAAALSALAFMATRHRAEARPDAISAASLTVAVKSITSTSATVAYSKDRYDYGTRTLCYDPYPTSPTHNCTTKTASGNSGSFGVTGLKPATKYNYSVKAIDTQGGEKPYTTSGNFTTLTATGVVVTVKPALVPGTARGFDLSGRALPAGAAANNAKIVTRAVR